MTLFIRIFVLAFWSLFLFQSCGINNATKGNGNITTKEINISNYEQIQLSGLGDVIYEQRSWEAPYLQISTDDNILPLLDIKVENGILKISPLGGQNINPSRLRIHTNSTNLKAISVSGSGDIHLSGEINSDDVKLSIAGSGTVASDSLYCQKLELDISGSGKAQLGGVCNDAKFSIAGSGNIEGFGYQVQNLNCNISGSGDINIHVNKSLNASVAGSGNIRYKGQPESVTQHVSGSGDITKEN